VEDYRSVGLSLRAHPVAFLRPELRAQNFLAASNLPAVRDGRRMSVAGIVLVRQRPGSARGVMFITLEDETGHANLIVWPSMFEANRRLILSATMIGVHGLLQREGEVTHVIARELTDLSDLLRSVGARGAFPLPFGRGDEAKHGGGPDPRGNLPRGRDIYVPDMRADAEIRVKTRDFR
jgi:error-prone DNA polymerase